MWVFLLIGQYDHTIVRVVTYIPRGRAHDSKKVVTYTSRALRELAIHVQYSYDSKHAGKTSF